MKKKTGVNYQGVKVPGQFNLKDYKEFKNYSTIPARSKTLFETPFSQKSKKFEDSMDGMKNRYNAFRNFLKDNSIMSKRSSESDEIEERGYQTERPEVKQRMSQCSPATLRNSAAPEHIQNLELGMSLQQTPAVAGTPPKEIDEIEEVAVGDHNRPFYSQREPRQMSSSRQLNQNSSDGSLMRNNDTALQLEFQELDPTQTIEEENTQDLRQHLTRAVGEIRREASLAALAEDPPLSQEMGDIGGVGGNECINPGAEPTTLVDYVATHTSARSDAPVSIVKLRYRVVESGVDPSACLWNQYVSAKEEFQVQIAEGGKLKQFENLGNLLKQDHFGANHQAMAQNQIQTLRFIFNNELVDAKRTLDQTEISAFIERYGSLEEMSQTTSCLVLSFQLSFYRPLQPERAAASPDVGGLMNRLQQMISSLKEENSSMKMTLDQQVAASRESPAILNSLSVLTEKVDAQTTKFDQFQSDYHSEIRELKSKFEALEGSISNLAESPTLYRTEQRQNEAPSVNKADSISSISLVHRISSKISNLPQTSLIPMKRTVSCQEDLQPRLHKATTLNIKTGDSVSASGLDLVKEKPESPKDDEPQTLTRKQKLILSKMKDALHQRFIDSNCKNVLDMAFLYADPIVKQGEDGKLVPVNQPLNLEAEYQRVVDSLKTTNKQFTIKKEAINFQSLQQIIKMSPKIIHISAHGAYDSDRKEFYLAIEGLDNGVEDLFSESRLSKLLEVPTTSDGGSESLIAKEPHKVKVAFVSACQSEEIGEIFLKAGIPIVIAVNSEQEIMDKVCKLFSREFYTNLLQGETIRNAFEQARRTVQVSPEDFETCCCAHKHDDDCVWYKFYQKDWKAAHELHSKECSCNTHGFNGRRVHQKNCPALVEFKKFIQEEKQKAKGSTPAKVNDDPFGFDDEPEVKGGGGGGLADLDFDAFEEDSDILGDDFEDMMVNDIVPQDATEEDCIMCCCRKETPHDETMKFTLKVSPIHAVNTKTGLHILDCTLFNQRGDGSLVDLDEEQNNRIKIPSFVDSKMVFGRHNEIYESVNFLTHQGNDQRILILNGIYGSGAASIARYSIKYVMNRHCFEDGSFYIDAQNKMSTQGLLGAISKQMHLIFLDQDELIDMIKNLKIVLLIDNCSQIIEKDLDNFRQFLELSVLSTNHLKFVLITDLDDDPLVNDTRISLNDHSLSAFTKKIKVNPLDKLDAVKLIYQLNQENSEFITRYPTLKDLNKHEIFNDFRFTPLQISQICMLLNNGQSLDQIYEGQVEEESLKNKSKTSKRIESKINKFIYRILREQFPTEVKIVHILSLAPTGLSHFDLVRISQMKSGRYGDWQNLLSKVLMQDIGSVALGQPTEPTTANGQQQQSSILLSGMEKYKSQFMRDMEEDHSDRNSQASQAMLNFNALKQNANLQIVLSEFLPNIGQQKFTLQGQFQEFIRESQEDLALQRMVEKDYLKYLGLLSRQLLVSIKYLQVIEFNPYIVSTQIEAGIWAEPSCLKYEMSFPNSDYSKNQVIDSAVEMFWMHETNFAQVLELPIMQDADFLAEDANQRLIEEVCLNVPSILIMLDKFKEAKEYLEKVEVVLTKAKLDFIKAKVNLVQISLQLEFADLSGLERKLSSVDEVFADYNNDEGLGETFFLKAIQHMKSIEKIKKVLAISTNEIGDQWSVGDSTDRERKPSFKASTQRRRQQYKNSIKSHMGFTMDISGNVKQEYEDAIQMLEQARQLYQTSQIQKAKTWIVQAELMLDVAQSIDEIQGELDQQELGELEQNLAHQASVFSQNQLYILETRTLVQQAKINFRLGKYVEAREQTAKCLNFSQEMNLHKIQVESAELQEAISLKLQIELNNLFIFAKSFPLMQPSEYNSVAYKHVEDERDLMINTLNQTNKQLNLRFEVLNLKFLRNLTEFGSKVLHLTPHFFTIENNQQVLVVEDDNFHEITLTPEELKNTLKPKEGNLSIYLVVIELTNCAKFCEVFLELGVNHVISFTSSPKLGQPLHVDEQVSEQFRLNLAADFMKQFTLKLYPQIMQDQSIRQAINTAQKQAQEKFLSSNLLTLNIRHDMQNLKQGDKLYDNVRLDQRKRIKEGQVCDISPITAQTNFKLSSTSGSFIIRKENLFLQLTNLLIEEKTSKLDSPGGSKAADETSGHGGYMNDINIYGARGSGKTRLVQEVAHYLRFRQLFGAGIFSIDLSKVGDFAAVNDLISFLKIDTSQKFEKKLQETMKKQGTFASMEMTKRTMTNFGNTEDDLLLIFDNCDQFVNQNRTSFELNLRILKRKIPQLQLILISEEPLDDQHNMKQLHVELFTFRESVLFIQAMNPFSQGFLSTVTTRPVVESTLVRKSAIHQLIELSGGNPQLLTFLCLIMKYGGIDLLMKVKILPTSQLKLPTKQNNNNFETSIIPSIIQDEEKDSQGFLNIFQSYLNQVNDRHNPTLMKRTSYMSAGAQLQMNSLKKGIQHTIKQALVDIKIGRPIDLAKTFQSIGKMSDFEGPQRMSHSFKDPASFKRKSPVASQGGPQAQQLTGGKIPPNKQRNKILDELIDEELKQDPRNVADFDKQTSVRDMSERDDESSFGGGDRADLDSRDKDEADGSFNLGATFKKGGLLQTHLKTDKFLKALELEKIQEQSAQSECKSAKEDSEVQPSPTSSFNAAQKNNLVTTCEGFHIQAFSTKGQELKIIVNPSLWFFEVLGYTQKGKRRLDKLGEKLSQGHSIRTFFRSLNEKDSEAKDMEGSQSTILAPLSDVQKLDIKEIVIYKPSMAPIKYDQPAFFPSYPIEEEERDDDFDMDNSSQGSDQFFMVRKKNGKAILLEEPQANRILQKINTSILKQTTSIMQSNPNEMRTSKTLIDNEIANILQEKQTPPSSQGQVPSDPNQQDLEKLQEMNPETVRQAGELLWKLIAPKITNMQKTDLQQLQQSMHRANSNPFSLAQSEERNSSIHGVNPLKKHSSDMPNEKMMSFQETRNNSLFLKMKTGSFGDNDSSSNKQSDAAKTQTAGFLSRASDQMRDSRWLKSSETTKKAEEDIEDELSERESLE